MRICPGCFLWVFQTSCHRTGATVIQAVSLSTPQDRLGLVCVVRPVPYCVPRPILWPFWLKPELFWAVEFGTDQEHGARRGQGRGAGESRGVTLHPNGILRKGHFRGLGPTIGREPCKEDSPDFRTSVWSYYGKCGTF